VETRPLRCLVVTGNYVGVEQHSVTEANVAVQRTLMPVWEITLRACTMEILTQSYLAHPRSWSLAMVWRQLVHVHCVQSFPSACLSEAPTQKDMIFPKFSGDLFSRHALWTTSSRWHLFPREADPGRGEGGFCGSVGPFT